MAQRKYKYEADYTSNNSVYNRAIKIYRQHTGELSCSWCPYHKGDNSTFRGYGTPQSWKRHRKTQYKPVVIGR